MEVMAQQRAGAVGKTNSNTTRGKKIHIGLCLEKGMSKGRVSIVTGEWVTD